MWLIWQNLSLIGFKLFTTQSRLLTTQKKELFENIEGKGENTGNKHFLLFRQCFFPSQFEFQFLSQFFSCLQINAFSLDQSKKLSFSKELNIVGKESSFPGYLTHSHTMTPFDASGKQAF